MEQIINPSIGIEGTIKIPASKSFGQRAYAAALVVKGETIIHNFGNSDDENAALEIIQQAGAKVNILSEDQLSIKSDGIIHKDLHINCGESGLSARMFTPLLSVNSETVNISAKGTLLTRPMHFFDAVFTDLKVQFESNQGRLPFKLKGPIIPENCIIDGSLSSQFITGLIYAYVASSNTRKVQIEIKNPTSIPYILLTLQVLSKFGVDIKFEKNTLFFDGPYVLKPTSVSVEGDWSSASFLLVAAAISGSITIDNLDINSNQADKKIIEALRAFGAEVTINGTSVRVLQKERNPFRFDATHCPDLFPPLAVLAMFSEGVSTLKGVKRLYNKESNRAVAIEQELGKMGAKIVVENNDMFIKGIDNSKAATVHSHDDHRIAMACAVAAMKANGPVKIQEAQAINKSYPAFYEHLSLLTGEKATAFEDQALVQGQ